MLQRVESAITVADSCQSLSPGPTPKKRPYTQVFSTPITCRLVKRPRNEATPESPLPIIRSKGAARSLFADCDKSGTVEAQTQTEPGRDSHWTALRQSLISVTWLADATRKDDDEIEALVKTPSYADTLSHARRHFDVLAQAGDFEHDDTADLAKRYILDHHLIRVERHFGTAQDGSRSGKSGPTKPSLPPSPSADCVPPTPPGSDRPDIKYDEAVSAALRRDTDQIHPADLAREQTEQDTVPDLIDGHVGRLESETLLPWPASGTMDETCKDKRAGADERGSKNRRSVGGLNTDVDALGMGNELFGVGDVRRSKRLLRSNERS
ncbi:protein of unknown function [Taphrina deformans PYCC 5710]|uniref:Uncharacterized protein n=1 Tax=Taphrina deformans (strain PYCC 5710 / ATCC 11124 / CBS 356.35 / IMI 108563 / JCM 9778 / NBRC 8474) TaxID=1097556 RepID=R4XAC6_TAPDE|nr:protein of unknown function [Taphrina deformans PYCC 5710]|eukprot:CCG82462.1 protein of unknown function [Taphrina deformans PYCC 5710]